MLQLDGNSLHAYDIGVENGDIHMLPSALLSVHQSLGTVYTNAVEYTFSPKTYLSLSIFSSKSLFWVVTIFA